MCGVYVCSETKRKFISIPKNVLHSKSIRSTYSALTNQTQKQINFVWLPHIRYRNLAKYSIPIVTDADDAFTVA